MTAPGHDLKRVPPNGTLILPLSCTRLHGAQQPRELFQFLEFFKGKVQYPSIDVVLLYTDALYNNDVSAALTLRQKNTHRIIRHRMELRRIIKKTNEYIPTAFHYLPWDFVTLNADPWDQCMSRLEKAYRSDPDLRGFVAADLNERGVSDANVRFVLEEIAVTHLIREKLVAFPRFLSADDSWHLVAYPSGVLLTDAYVHSAGLLPTNSNHPREAFRRHFYDARERRLVQLERFPLPAIRRGDGVAAIG